SAFFPLFPWSLEFTCFAPVARTRIREHLAPAVLLRSPLWRPNGTSLSSKQTKEWFDSPEHDSGEPGLRFKCTMCGNCCTGPEGYVLVTDEEIAALAKRLGMTDREFFDRYTHM